MSANNSIDEVVEEETDDQGIRRRTVFFFEQKTAYGIGVGDWSSDVCSSVLLIPPKSTSSLSAASSRVCPQP